MWNVSEQFRENCYDDSKKKRVVFNSQDMCFANEDISAESSVKFGLSSIKSQQVTFGEIPMNTCEVTILNDEGNLDGNLLINEEFDAHIGVEIDRPMYEAPENALSAAELAEGEKISIHSANRLTSSGVLATVEASGSGIPVESMTLAVEPNTIPASKNIARLVQDILDHDSTSNGVTYHATGETTLHISGTATSNSWMTTTYAYNSPQLKLLKKGTYTLSCNAVTGTSASGARVAGYYVGQTNLTQFSSYAKSGTKRTFTLDDDAHIWITMTIPSGDTIDQDVWVQLESGSAATEYTPHYLSHARDVSSVNVYSGINLFDGEFKTGWINNDMTIIEDSSERIVSKNYNSCEGGKSYYFTSTYNFRILWCDENKNAISLYGSYPPNIVVTAPDNARYFRLAFATSSVEYACLNYPSTVTSVQPYAIKKSISLGRSIAGGSLNVIDGVGKETWHEQKASDFPTWRRHNSGYFYAVSADTGKASGLYNVIGEGLTTSSGLTSEEYIICGRASDGAIYVRLTGTETLEEFHAWMDEKKIAFELETPRDFSFEPTSFSVSQSVGNFRQDYGTTSLVYLDKNPIRGNCKFDSISPMVLRGTQFKIMFLYDKLYIVSTDGTEFYFSKNERISPYHYGAYEEPSGFEKTMLHRFFLNSSVSSISYYGSRIYELTYDSDHPVDTTWGEVVEDTWDGVREHTWGYLGGYTLFSGIKYESVPFGVWRFSRPRRVREAILTLSGHDRMSVFDVDSVEFAKSNSSTPMTIRYLITQIANYVGMPIGDLSSLNEMVDEIKVDASVYYQYKTLKDLLSYCFEVGACNCIIDREGNLSASNMDNDPVVIPFMYSFDVADSVAHTLSKALVYRQGDYSLYQQDESVEEDATYEWYDNPFFNQSSYTASWFSNGCNVKYGGFRNAIADTMADFSLWCDDVYSFEYDGVTYREPIFTMSVEFNGTGRVVYTNDGTEEREIGNYGSRIESVSSVNDDNLRGFNEAKYADKLYFDANGLTIESQGMRIKNHDGDEVLSADASGNLTVKGRIEAESGYVGNWDISDDNLVCTAVVSGTDIYTMLLGKDEAGQPSFITSEAHTGSAGDSTYTANYTPRGFYIRETRNGTTDTPFYIDYNNTSRGRTIYFSALEDDDVQANNVEVRFTGGQYNFLTPRLYTSGQFYILSPGTTASSANACFVNTSFGQQLCKTSSLRKVKDNIKTIENPSEKVDNLRGVSFTSKCEADDPKQVFYGFIAEEVEEAVPQLASYEDGKLQSVQYDRVCALLVEDLKACHRRIETLEHKIEELERKVK